MSCDGVGPFVLGTFPPLAGETLCLDAWICQAELPTGVGHPSTSRFACRVPLRGAKGECVVIVQALVLVDSLLFEASPRRCDHVR